MNIMFNPRVTVQINDPKVISDRILNDKVGMFVAATWHRYFDKFTPMKTGTLRDTVSYKPYVVTYESPYAHYMWQGIKYIDPLIKASGWFDVDAGRWYSHKGVEKIPTTVPLNYNKELNPLATSHWEVPAYKTYVKRVANEITEYIKTL